VLTRRTLFKTIAALAATALVPPAFWLAGKADPVSGAVSAAEIDLLEGWKVKHKYRTNIRQRPLIPNEVHRIISDHFRTAARQIADAEFREFYNLEGVTHA
jgi:hypothetical protein